MVNGNHVATGRVMSNKNEIRVRPFTQLAYIRHITQNEFHRRY